MGKEKFMFLHQALRSTPSIPGGNTYGDKDGTSMASPVVAGLASLILSYFPELTAQQVKKIIEASVVKITDPIAIKPGTEDEKISFSSLSINGGIVNAYEAILLASKTKGERKIVEAKEKRN